MIGIICPTRGMVFSKVVEAIERERKGFDTQLYISSDLVIPDGHNQLAKKALDDGCDSLLFIEEDVIIPARAFDQLLKVDSDIACVDYGVSGWGCVTRDKTGEILWCGLGCTLIKRAVFDALEEPWFRTDKQLRLNDWTWIDVPENYQKNVYGTLDIWFCTQARKKGFKIVQIKDMEAEHLNLVSLGKRETNHGLHVIERKPEISKHQVLEEGKPV